MHAFETESGAGDTIEVSIPPNRYTDAASHWGIAREAAAILNLKSKEIPPLRNSTPKILTPLYKGMEPFKIEVRNKKLCPRYVAAYFENIKVGSSPKWMQKVLKDCGFRPINNVVDIMNYTMLETGEPLHAFDADKITGGIFIRQAKEGERITSIDGVPYRLTKDMLVIADKKQVLAIAGIKGGRGSEVTLNTKRIIVEAANFDARSIYRTSKALNLKTDASIRFSHGIHPFLAGEGMNRAMELLKKESGAKLKGVFDSEKKPPPRRLLKFDIDEFNHLIGGNLDFKIALGYLKRLGFKVRGKLIEIPVLRPDIETHEDLAEEVARLFGYNRLKPQPPQVALKPPESDERLIFKDKIRRILAALGLNEVYHYSFVSDEDLKKFGLRNYALKLENPLSREFNSLRPSLIPNLLKGATFNSKFLTTIKTFEIGRVFMKTGKKTSELETLAIMLASEKEEMFFELKGIMEQLFEGIGLVDYAMVEPSHRRWVNDFTKGFISKNSLLEIESDHKGFAYLGKSKTAPAGWQVSVFEADLERLFEFVEGEKEYRPMPKYPSVMRDLSLLVRASVKIGDIIQEIQAVNVHLIEDVDLIDEYRDPNWKNRQSITLRIVFQSDKKTLTNTEVDREMKKIVARLEDKFGAQIR